MPRARLIYNPTAGRELIEKNLSKVLSEFEQAGYETSCLATQHKWHAAEAAVAAADKQFDIVVAAGGDGTLYEVINGLSQHAAPPKLGILPVGTSNDFARALKLPRDMLDACRVIAQGKTTRVDLGRHGDHYFVNAAAAGRLTEVTHEAPSRLKTMMGNLAYYAKALENLSTLNKTFSITLQTEERTWTEDVLLILIANSFSVGGFDKLAPLAQLSDGLLDVMLIHKGNLPDMVQIAALAMRGEHIHDPRVTYFQTPSLMVTTPQTLSLNLDGEWGGDCNGRFEVVPNALEVFCP